MVRFNHGFGAIQEDHGLVRPRHAKGRDQALKGITNCRQELSLSIRDVEAPVAQRGLSVDLRSASEIFRFGAEANHMDADALCRRPFCHFLEPGMFHGGVAGSDEQNAPASGTASRQSFRGPLQTFGDIAVGNHLGPAGQVSDRLRQFPRVMTTQDLYCKCRIMKSGDTDLEAPITQQAGSVVMADKFVSSLGMVVAVDAVMWIVERSWRHLRRTSRAIRASTPGGSSD